MTENRNSQINTRHLGTDKHDTQPAISHRGTGPLDYFMPWVIEFRIIGTPSVMQVKVQEKMLVGRSDRNDGPQPDIDFTPHEGYEYGISRQHAVISAMNSRITVRDLNSANGTFVNGGKLEPHKEYRIAHGDRLTFGKLELQVIFVVTPSSYEKNAQPYADINIPEIGSGQSILILDEDPQVAQTIAGLMRVAGFDVSIANNVSTALSLIDTQRPDAIILELLLGNLSGVEFIQHLRTKPDCTTLPIIVVSNAGDYQLGQAISAGANVCLGKPVGADELITEFSDLLPLMKRKN